MGRAARMANIIVTHYVNDRPVHRQVRESGIRRTVPVLLNVMASEQERHDSRNPVIARDMFINGVGILVREFGDGARCVTFISIERGNNNGNA